MTGFIAWFETVRIPLTIALPARFVSDVAAHPVGAAGVAGMIAYVVAERWQRWRQRRDFQHRAMVEFAESTIGLMNALHTFTPTLTR
jgi:hypothetical protein